MFKAPVAFGTEIIVGINTDDLMVTVDTDEHWQAMLLLLNTEFIVKDLGLYLGVAYEQDRSLDLAALEARFTSCLCWICGHLGQVGSY